MFAAALEPNVRRTIADLNGFDPNDDEDWLTRHYVPVVRSLGDLTMAAHLIAPRPLTIIHPADDFDLGPWRQAFGDSPAVFTTVQRAPEPAQLIRALQ